MTTTPQKNGTVTINGRVYTHKRSTNGSLLRPIDLSCADSILSWAEMRRGADYEEVRYYVVDDPAIIPLPANTTRPRELKDVIAELAKGGVLWVKNNQDRWYPSCNAIDEESLIYWNCNGALLSTNPFKENPKILGPEITEEVKP